MPTRKRKPKKTWVYSPPSKPKPKVPEDVKHELQKRGDEIVNNILKPKYLEPIPEELKINHLIDIFTKWYHNYFYFCSKYKCPPDALSSTFESKFARMEYLENDKFELSYMRHTGEWWRLETGSMDDCLKNISTMIPY